MRNGAVLITGASGLVGTWLRRTASERTELVGVAHRSRVDDCAQVVVDLRDVDAVRTAMGEVRPSLVIHAAYALDHPSIVQATRNVADAAVAVGAEVLYVSTDAVFSGDGTMVSEASVPSPVWSYGAWKLAAENLVLASSDRAAIVRLPLVVSLEPADAAAKRIARLTTDHVTPGWYIDEVRQPARALAIAKGLWRIANLSPQERRGVWHLPGPERLSRYDIALRYASALEVDATAIRSAPTPPAARRPRDLWMGDHRSRKQIGWDPLPVLV